MVPNRQILDYLRYGELVTQDSNLLKGVKKLANYLGLTELVKELGSREEDGDWVTLDLDGRKEIKMSLKTLTRCKPSTLAMYFLGDEEAENKLSQCQWIKKENETRYFIGCPLEMCESLFEFLRSNRPIDDYFVPEDKISDFLAELELFGLNYFLPTTGWVGVQGNGLK